MVRLSLTKDPSLFFRLLPHAEHTVFCRGASHSHQQHNSIEAGFVIDGPGLVYHVYGRLFCQKHYASNAIDDAPSYAELGAALLSFLAKLEECGQTVDRIFFDGALPEDKLDTRLQRLEQQLKRLLTLRAKRPAGFKDPLEQDDEQGLDVGEWKFDPFKFARLPPELRDIPVLPFIVPAALDALSASKYANVTVMVPGEADDYCAEYARVHGSYVLTSDTDLLQYDTGPGGVIFLNQLELQPAAESEHSGDTALQAPVFNLCRTAGTTGFSDVLKLAEASKQYANQLVDTAAWNPISCPSPSFLDPRLSEVVVQLGDHDRRAVRSFLLPLIEDPSRASAWSVASKLLSFAYACIASSCSRETDAGVRSVMEYQRRGTRYVETEVELAEASLLRIDVEKQAKEINVDMKSLQEELSNIGPLPPLVYWRCFGLLGVLSILRDCDKTPDLATVRSVISRRQGRGTSWETIHLTAQVQTFLYSLRMIKQSLAYMKDAQTDTAWSLTLNELHASLADLPVLSILLATNSQVWREISHMDRPEACDKILQAVERLYYRPSHAESTAQELRQRSLRTQKASKRYLSKRKKTKEKEEKKS